jgi:peptidyl-prolyl cis-trans isomerase SurA
MRKRSHLIVTGTCLIGILLAASAARVEAAVLSLPPDLPSLSSGKPLESGGILAEKKLQAPIEEEMKSAITADTSAAKNSLTNTPQPLPEGAIGVVAVVNDDVISSIDLQDRVKLILGSTRIEDTPENRKRIVPQAVRILIDEKIQLQEAASQSISVTEDDIKNAIASIEQRSNKPPGSLEADLNERGLPKRSLYQQIKAQIAWSKVIGKSVRPKIRISDGEIERAKKKSGGGSTRAEVQISTILLPVDKPASENNVKALAEKLASEISAGASFDEVARQFTSGGTGQAAGAFWVEPAQLDPLISAAISSLNNGQVAAPVRTIAGYQIVKLLDKRTGNASVPQSQKQAEIAMKHLTMKLKPDAAQKEAEVMLTIAREVSKNPGTCLSKSIANIDNISDLDIEVEFIRNLLSRLPDGLRTIIEPLNVGQVSEPFATPEGIHIYMMCERINLPDLALAPAVEEAPAEEVRNQLFAQKIELEAMKYLRNLRRDAFVDIRIR